MSRSRPGKDRCIRHSVRLCSNPPPAWRTLEGKALGFVRRVSSWEPAKRRKKASFSATRFLLSRGDLAIDNRCALLDVQRHPTARTPTGKRRHRGHGRIGRYERDRRHFGKRRDRRQHCNGRWRHWRRQRWNRGPGRIGNRWIDRSSRRVGNRWCVGERRFHRNGRRGRIRSSWRRIGRRGRKQRRRGNGWFDRKRRCRGNLGLGWRFGRCERFRGRGRCRCNGRCRGNRRHRSNRRCRGNRRQRGNRRHRRSGGNRRRRRKRGRERCCGIRWRAGRWAGHLHVLRARHHLPMRDRRSAELRFQSRKLRRHHLSG